MKTSYTYNTPINYRQTLAGLIQSFKFDSLSSAFYALSRITEENTDEDIIEVLLFESFEYSEEVLKAYQKSIGDYYVTQDDIRKVQIYNNTKGEGYYIVIRGIKPVEKTYTK